MGRLGGVSRGPFASFNLAGWIGDDQHAVDENWCRWGCAHPGMTPVRSNQVHATRIRTINTGGTSCLEDADGMVTAAAGLALCVFTADCVPILLIDPERRIVGAVHAGWRGTLRNIAAEGVRAMVALGARYETIEAALGPAIGICCFEVDAELADRFVAKIGFARSHRRAGRVGKAYLDLRAINRDQLREEGLAAERITGAGPCTRCANDRFFSRRASRGSTSGLQMSFIGFAE